jgi:TorA maturation chaperone TorD
MAELESLKASAQEDLCRYLSACFYEPTVMFAEEGMFDSMRKAAGRLSVDLAEHARRLGEAFAGDDLQTLLVDYTRLFLGPVNPRATPYGSFWLSGESALMQDSTVAVLDLYRQGGFELDEGFRDLPDHIAVELEFLYVLTFRLHQVQRDADLAATASLIELRERFLGAHLGRWVGRFTSAMQQGAETRFYRTLAELTRLWVAQFGAPGPAH